MVSGKETKVASLVLTLVIAVLLLLPIDVKAAGMSQGCSLWQRMCYPFLHASILHAAVNCWCLLSICFNQSIHIWKLLAAYIIAISYPELFMGSQSTVGMSGLIFALLGIISLSAGRWYINIPILVCIASCGFLLPNINATLHLYSYIVGLMVGMLTTPLPWSR